MGVDFKDYNNDGWPDVFIGALANEKYALFRNLKGTSSTSPAPTGVGEHHHAPLRLGTRNSSITTTTAGRTFSWRRGT